jgi:uncharacterized protein YeaO (DUF488 family)
MRGLTEARDETADDLVRTRRWNDPAEVDDGYRLLVCRFRPRGVSKDAETWDAWCKALAPSEPLHAAAYGKGGPAIAWDVYTRRYLEEMGRQRFWIQGFADRVKAGERLTLLCSSACVDEGRCHRTLLASLVRAAARPAASERPAAAAAARTVVKRR